jgi:hypothetical protein
MSQSDYIKHLKLATELKQQTSTDFPPVFESGRYTAFKQYTVVNNVKNTSPLYDEFVPTGITNIFGVPLRNIATCPTFVACTSTNTRPNRVAMSTVYFTPTPVVPYVKQPNNRKCSACCYDTAVNSTNAKIANKSNFFNTNYTGCGNYRLRKMRCNCKLL